MAIYNLYEEYENGNIENLLESVSSDIDTVFISHRSIDKQKAKIIADYLNDIIKVDVYLDIYDINLKESKSNNDYKGIVDCINKGLTKATYLICLITENTKGSWWVPYEIGVADANNKEIISLRCKQRIEEIPEYLKIRTIIETVDEFSKFCNGLRGIINEIFGTHIYYKIIQKYKNDLRKILN